MSHYERPEYDTLIQTRATKDFAEALNRAAAAHMQSRSDFIRGTLLDRLKQIRANELAGAA